MADRTLVADAVPGTVLFAADGKTITALCRDNAVRTWAVESGKLEKTKKVAAGSMLLSASLYAERTEQKTMRVWDLTAERQAQIVNGLGISRGTVSRDGKWLATASTDARNVKIWSMATGAEQRTMADGIGGTARLFFSPDGETLVSSNYDNDIRIWRTASGELIRKMEDLTGAMFAGEFTADGKWLVMGGLDETVYIWDARTFQLVKKLGGQGEVISALAISPNGKTLVTGGFDVLAEKNPVTIVFWDLAGGGKIVRKVQAPHRVASLAFSPDGKWVAMTAGEKEIGLWRL